MILKSSGLMYPFYKIQSYVVLIDGSEQLGPHLVIYFDMKIFSIEKMYEYMNTKLPFGRIIDTGYTGSKYNWRRLENSPEFYEFAIKE
jgi:hypothetical protein